MPYLKLDITWKTRVIAALKTQTPQTGNQIQERRLIGALENLRKQHVWGDLSDEKYKSERETLARQLKLVSAPTPMPQLPNLERSAQFLDDLQVLWQHPGATDQQREELIREVFHRITIEGKDFQSIEPKPAYAPLFASMVTDERYGYQELESTPTPP
jgi:hypothetical protein